MPVLKVDNPFACVLLLCSDENLKKQKQKTRSLLIPEWNRGSVVIAKAHQVSLFCHKGAFSE